MAKEKAYKRKRDTGKHRRAREKKRNKVRNSEMIQFPNAARCVSKALLKLKKNNQFRPKFMFF